ncbi:ribonuclease D [Roseiconus nitratireducens]|uniref:Ribonuclease D n=1 Tax=Roseiconus nitratireducens TaxID=2605748 RepID=A0A5M6DH38_9BACT|nr:HRDC domain-containing protein [Roseiconus nitratireducens]KAA5546868.1 ribonuclease D [Roseiconus nitratireducens]
MTRSSIALEYESITAIDDLRQFCEELADAPIIAFDTEFVSEDRYRPQLCLIQVAAGDRLAIIDPLAMHTTAPFWDLLVQPDRTVIAHAAREESRFCYRHTQKPIAGLFDTQLAAGFSGMEYPISLGNLVHRLTGRTLAKGESRTNWRRRPLSDDQIQYALQDVTDLQAMHQMQLEKINTLGRLGWLEEETELRQRKVIDHETSENWRKVSGCAGLSPRQLEIIRHLWRWREKRASTLDRPVRRVMRDDLMVELAKRGSADVKKIRSIRGMDWRGYSAHYGDIAAAIEDALAVPDDQLPRRRRRSRSVISPMLSQFLSTSMACISRQNKLAPSIVGNTDDVKEVLGYELDRKDDDATPSLLTGWRGEIVGKTFRKLLSGDVAIRVANVRKEQPLEFIEIDAPSDG